MKKQVIVIHGGDAFKTRKAYLAYLKNYKLNFKKLKTGGWKENLTKKLGRDFEAVLFKMPNPLNARYKEWKIMFSKLLPFLKNRIVLVGHSLGGIFLAKYLSEKWFPKKILATFLIAPPYDEKDRKSGYSLFDFVLPKNLTRFQKQGGKIFIYQSEDDPVVPFVDANKYKKALSTAKIMAFKNKGHFNQIKFPELINHIKKIFK